MATNITNLYTPPYGLRLPPMTHIAIVVHDVDKTIDYYNSIGFGPWEVIDIKLRDYNYRGKTVDARIKCGMMWGSVNLELMQVLEGECPHADFLKEHGEGVHHFGFEVKKDLPRLIKNLVAAGCEVVFSGEMPEWRSFGTYVDASKLGGIQMWDLYENW